MRKLATIQIVADVQPIENADAIEKIKIKDWWVVSQKGNLKPGDFCVYFEIDSLLPTTNPAFEFLAKGNKPKNAIIDGEECIGYGYRLKTIKLRGQISQGLAIPIADHTLWPPAYLANVVKEGDDVSDILKIVKYERPIPASLAGIMKGGFPGFIRKTNEDRVQNLGELISELQQEKFYISEKLDGSSSTFYMKNGELGVCSRNLELVDTPENTLWEIARKYDLANIIPEGYAIQGEIMGEGIQKNPLKLTGHELYVYNVFIIDNQQYLNFDQVALFCEQRNLKMVPIIDKDYTLNVKADGLIAMADGNSILNENAKREGIVLRPLEEKQAEINGVLSRLSFKAISNEYLLKNQ